MAGGIRHSYGLGLYRYDEQHGRCCQSWLFNKRHGQCTFTSGNGEKYVGEYRDGQPWTGIIYGADQSILVTVTDGELCSGCKPFTEDRDTIPATQTNRKLVSTGTGFLVAKNYTLTASHVIEECAAVRVRHSHEEIDVAIAAWDETNDLGLLKSPNSFDYTAKFRGGKSIRKGDTVVNYGYPLTGALSDAAKVAKGEINSLAGLGNDSRFIQYDAATQLGNSGGPVLDLSGNVVGVVSHLLGKKYADSTGHIAQNVNFAVKSYVTEGFLSSNGVEFERAESKGEMRTADIGEKAERFTVLVGCWQ